MKEEQISDWEEDTKNAINCLLKGAITPFQMKLFIKQTLAKQKNEDIEKFMSILKIYQLEFKVGENRVILREHLLKLLLKNELTDGK